MQSNLVQVVSESSEISPYTGAQHDDKILFYFTIKAEKKKKYFTTTKHLYEAIYTVVRIS